ncbi:RagB/SusD family nutrient uptake outer membrane protein [Mucilaginibacter terrae]|uniref:RagB/SusD family nutrient uptake outer membrane protein n=1 Tax=Mucilaginibacter terrae TaxID=1955052 RepID=UPI00362ECF8A
MKYNSYIIKCIFASLLVASIASCTDTIDVEPRQSIPAETALTNVDNVDAAITSVYSTLKSTALYGNRLITLPDALADNGQATNKSGRLLNESRNVRGAHFSHWATSYNNINKINQILEAIPALTGPTLTDARKNQYIGELKCLRALLVFDLVRAYAYIPGATVAAKEFGGVPLLFKATTNITDALALKPSRATLTATYDAIYKDLDDALPIINTTSAVSRVNRTTALALYSRVALYRKDFAKVIAVSTEAINLVGSRLLSPSTYINGWSTGVNPESIFEVTFQINSENIGVNESLQTSFTTLVIRGNRAQTGGFGDLVPTSTMLADLGITATGNGTTAAAITARSGDVRNLLFELGTTGRGSPFVECTKFLGKNGSINLDNVPVFRVAELYLNRAEAYAETGDAASALLDVNRIRANRGLADVTGLTGLPLINQILLQDRVEFAFEGHRFFDLKRRGLDILKPATSTTLAFTDDVILPGIPQADLDGNPNLKQNNGY